MIEFSENTVEKAADLPEDYVLQDDEHPEVFWVRGGRDYRVQLDPDLVWATCTCPHGQNNANARCYHAAAAYKIYSEQQDTIAATEPTDDPAGVMEDSPGHTEHVHGSWPVSRQQVEDMTVAELKQVFYDRSLEVPPYGVKADLREALIAVLEGEGEK